MKNKEIWKLDSLVVELDRVKNDIVETMLVLDRMKAIIMMEEFRIRNIAYKKEERRADNQTGCYPKFKSTGYAVPFSEVEKIFKERKK